MAWTRSTVSGSLSCRVGHVIQWTHSKFAEPYDEDIGQDTDESLDAAWNCTIPFDIDQNDQAVHLGVYAAQAQQAVELPSRSPSILSAVGFQPESNITVTEAVGTKPKECCAL